MRDGNAPNMARWLAEGTHRLAEWETDLSSQTGASQAGILLGSNEDIPAFRWVEKETATLMTCSAPPDCAEIERRRATGIGLLTNGGASRGNLLSGEADHVILTVSRIEAEKKANPGYRAFLANGFNVTRALVLFGWEVILELVASARQRRRDVRPRGHRGGLYPFMRAAMCVVVRDLIVYGVLTDMMKGRPAVYATFSSYDEVAHHSGLERHDTLEALRKLDEQFGRIDARAATRRGRTRSSSSPTTGRRRAPPSSSGTATGSTTSSSARCRGSVTEIAGGDEQDSMVGHALGEATGRTPKKKRSKKDVSGENVVVLGSGNLGSSTSWRSRAGSRGGDRAAPSSAPAGASRAPARRLAARSLGATRAGGARCPRGALARGRPRRGRGPAGRLLSQCCAPPTRTEGSPTSRTSWSGASTTPSSTKAARSRS